MGNSSDPPSTGTRHRGVRCFLAVVALALGLSNGAATRVVTSAAVSCAAATLDEAPPLAATPSAVRRTGRSCRLRDIDPGDVWVNIEEAGLDITDYIYSATFPYVPAGNNYQLILSDDLVQTQLVDISPLRERIARARLIHSSAATPTIDIVATGVNLPLIKNVQIGRASCRERVL